MAQKIQFIGYQITTSQLGSKDNPRENTKYTGSTDQLLDIDARCKIMMDAIEAAYRSEHIDRQAQKIFVAPELFFRGGQGGAYNIENIGYINTRMDTWLADKKYEKWIKKSGGWMDGR